MTAEQNVLLSVPEGLKTTAAAAFVEKVTFADIPTEAMRIGTRCLLDGLGLSLRDRKNILVRLLIEETERRPAVEPDALLLGRGNTKVPAPMAARVLGIGRSCP